MPADSAFSFPRDRHYDAAHHLWAQRDPTSGRVRIGIDAIGVAALGELAYVALEPDGAVVARGGPLGTLEAAKMTTAISAPAGGRIVARNEAVLADPRLVDRDPYGRGWLVEIEPARWQQDAAALLSGDAIAPWAAAERARLDQERALDA